MEHYFIPKKHNEDNFFEYEVELNNKNFNFTSCDCVFSKNKLDYGSRALINTLIKNFKDERFKKVLDVCCGNGVIGIILNKFLVIESLELCDINSTAVELANINLLKNNVKTKAYESNLFDNVKNIFDLIVSNPPIKTGKKILFKLAEESSSYLNFNGKFCLVIRKDLGMESLKKKLLEIYGNCEILSRDKGYYILFSQKMS